MNLSLFDMIWRTLLGFAVMTGGAMLFDRLGWKEAYNRAVGIFATGAASLYLGISIALVLRLCGLR